VKLPKGADGTTLYDWASFIAAESKEELDMIAERNPEVKKAVVKLLELSADEQVRDLYERREKERRDIASLVGGARREERFDIARKMLVMNVQLDIIVKATGLTSEEIKDLLDLN